MVPFVVVVSLELADRPAQRGFAHQDHAVEARLLDRAHKALGDGVEIRRARWEADRLNARSRERLSKGGREERIAIVQQEALPTQKPIDGIGKLTTALPIHALSGSDMTPAISTRRVARSITNRTANRVSPPQVHTSTVKKSAAASTSQCAFRNSCHVVRL